MTETPGQGNRRRAFSGLFSFLWIMPGLVSSAWRLHPGTKKARKGNVGTSVEWRLNSENDSRLHGQPSFTRPRIYYLQVQPEFCQGISNKDWSCQKLIKEKWRQLQRKCRSASPRIHRKYHGLAWRDLLFLFLKALGLISFNQKQDEIKFYFRFRQDF